MTMTPETRARIDKRDRLLASVGVRAYVRSVLFDYDWDTYQRSLRAYSLWPPADDGSTLTAFTDGTSSTLNRRWPNGDTLTVEPT